MKEEHQAFEKQVDSFNGYFGKILTAGIVGAAVATILLTALIVLLAIVVL